MNLSREWELLLACATTNAQREDRQKLRDSLGGDLDWPYVAKTACAHGVAPLVYRTLRTTGVIDQLPPAAMEKLRASYYRNAARNARLYEELRKVLAALALRSVDVILLKGAALADTVYPHRGLRSMSDIDVLVRREKLTAIEAGLVELGYRRDDRIGTSEWRQKHHYHLVFTAASSDIPLEIHWHIKRPSDRSRIEIEGFWQRAEAITLENIPTRILSPEDLLLHLCHHLCKHQLDSGIRPICDIAEAMSHYGDKIDWDTLAALALDWRLNPCLYLGLSLAQALLGTRTPQSFLEKLKPAGFDAHMVDWASQRILAYDEDSPVFPSLLQLFWKGHRLNERWAALKKTLAQKRVVEHDRPSRTGSCLYYPRRINHLLTRYGRTAYGLLRGDRNLIAAAEREENQRRLTDWLSSY